MDGLRLPARCDDTMGIGKTIQAPSSWISGTRIPRQSQPRPSPSLRSSLSTRLNSPLLTVTEVLFTAILVSDRPGCPRSDQNVRQTRVEGETYTCI